MKLRYFLFGLAMVLFFAACSSNKGADKTSGFNQWYQNTTAHYNGFFYARLKMTQIEQQVTAARKDDYNHLLDLFPAGNADDQVSANDMDSVIKRLTVVVKLHPKSKWTDDSYLMIGKAYYYKKDYPSALAIFQYVSGQFKGKNAESPLSGNSSPSSSSSSAQPTIHSKKPLTGAEKQKLLEEQESKEQTKAAATPSKPAASIGKKSMTHYEDQVWLARTLVTMQNYNEAAAVLSLLEQDPNFPSELKGMRAAVHSYLYIDQKQYQQAIDPMKDAAAFTTDKTWKNRYTYTLGQLYEMTGDYQNAALAFQKVASTSTNYDVILYAKLSEARAYEMGGAGNSAAILAMLEALSRDEKYDENNDVIYYYMGMVNMREGKEEPATKNFESSIRSGIGNSHQKGLSFLELGQMSFAEDDYMTAQPYYDSAVAFLDAKKMDTVDRVKKIQNVLDRLAAENSIIITEDSLQKIAAMSEADRDAFIDDLISQMKKKEAQVSKDSTEQANNFLNNPITPNGQNPMLASGSSTNLWYFYNTVSKSTGFNDFRSRWGSRDNGDNWRRSDKSSDNTSALVAPDNGGPTPGKNTSASAGGSLRDQMIANLPLTPEKLQASNDKIFNAYYTTGLIYKDELNQPAKATATFEKLAASYSDNKDIAQAYYCLYLLYLQAGNQELASKYKDLIVQNSPQSIYAQIVTDTNFHRKSNEVANRVSDYYALAYNSYQNAQYDDAMLRVRTADSVFSNHPLLAKFDLLGALCKGKTQDRTVFIAALDTFIAKHPSGEEHDAAINILVALGVRQAVTNVTPNNGSVNMSQKSNEKSPYTYRVSSPQYLVIVFNSTSPEIDGVIDSIANYNSQNHSLGHYKVTRQLLDTKTEMIVVKQMKDANEAMSYYNEIDGDDDLFDAAGELTYQMFAIDDQNFKLLMQRKNVTEYMTFFTANYDIDDNNQ